MRKETFLMSAMLFARERQHMLEKFSTIGGSDEKIRDIKAAMAEGALPEYKNAVIVYLNALINGSRRTYGLMRSVCGEELLKKLLDAGLTKIGR